MLHAPPTADPMTRETQVSQTNDENTSAADHDPEDEREAVAAVDEELDARSDGDGLAAEAGRAEETGISEG